MHDVRVNAGGSQMGVEADDVEEHLENSDEGAMKLYDLLNDADKSLDENTKHNKLGAIGRLYNLKCMGGWME
jgi:hypothetical protein